MRKSQLNRRRFLKGSGATLIALPLLEEALPNRASAQQAIPRRLITMSFGLGISQDLQAEGWNGPLEPFRDLAGKMAMFSNTNNSGIEGGGTPHFSVGATQFTGVRQDGRRQAGGPSLEQIMRLQSHPNGVVPSATGLPSASAGMWSRTGAITQYVRHWNSNGSAGERPERRPSKTFDKIFSNFQSTPTTPPANTEAEIEARIKRSVLDSVVDQYQQLTGANSYLGQESKERIEAHLEAIRSIERDLLTGDQAADDIEDGETNNNNAQIPDRADFRDPSGISFYDNASGPTTGPQVDWQAAQRAFQLNGQLFALGLSSDALRYGSMVFVGAGEHLRFTGTYNASNIGRSLNFSNTFRDASPHDGIFHRYNEDAIRVYQHYAISQLAGVLKAMDNIIEPNGRTVLDNTTVVITTEYGRNHDEDNIFHAIAGGEGLFKAGNYSREYTFGDVYKTIMERLGVRNHGIAGNTINEVLS